jgi:signal transduction histidine kinase
MSPLSSRPAFGWASAAVLIAILVGLLLFFRTERSANLHREIVGRAATLLQPEARQRLLDAEPVGGPASEPGKILSALLKAEQPDGILAVTIFDPAGNALQTVGPALLPAELPPGDLRSALLPGDLPRLHSGESISRYHPDFPLDRYFANLGGPTAQRRMPVLEVLLALNGHDPARPLGFVRYYLDARPIAFELDALDTDGFHQTMAILGVGTALVAGFASVGFGRAYRAVAKRNERLARENFELTLGTKACALDRITSHLIRSPQLSGMGSSSVGSYFGTDLAEATDWMAAAGHTDRLEAMIQETFARPSHSAAHAAIDLTGHEIAEIVRQRSAPAAREKGVVFSVSGGFDRRLDPHRAGLLCLIAGNLIQNAIDATDAGERIAVIFRNGGSHATVRVSDDGHGIRDDIRAHLFEPGQTSRPDGNGLGLVLSQLLARQINATLMLDSTGPDGTTFRVTLPLDE